MSPSACGILYTFCGVWGSMASYFRQSWNNKTSRNTCFNKPEDVLIENINYFFWNTIIMSQVFRFFLYFRDLLTHVLLLKSVLRFLEMLLIFKRLDSIFLVFFALFLFSYNNNFYCLSTYTVKEFRDYLREEVIKLWLAEVKYLLNSIIRFLQSNNSSHQIIFSTTYWRTDYISIKIQSCIFSSWEFSLFVNRNFL